MAECPKCRTEVTDYLLKVKHDSLRECLQNIVETWSEMEDDDDRKELDHAIRKAVKLLL